jgi:hypothetical protein
MVSNADLVIISTFCNNSFSCCYKLLVYLMSTSEQANYCFAVLFLYHMWLVYDVQLVFILLYKQFEDFVV